MDSLSVLAASPDREALHDLRLHAKKIKAIELLADLPKHYSNEKLRPIIQEAGDTRAAELNLQTLRKYGYQNLLLEQELNATAEEGFATIQRNNRQYRDEIIFLRKKYENELEDIREQKLTIFFISIVEELGAAFLWHIQEKDLHENRKKIKHLLYAYRFLPRKFREKFDFDEHYLDKLQELIGQWHDLDMALVLLQQKGLKHEPVYSSIQKEQQEMLKQIRSEIKLFRKKVRVSAPK